VRELETETLVKETAKDRITIKVKITTTWGTLAKMLFASFFKKKIGFGKISIEDQLEPLGGLWARK